MLEVRHWTESHHDHGPLHHSREEEEGNRNAKEGVEYTEGLPSI